MYLHGYWSWIFIVALDPKSDSWVGPQTILTMLWRNWLSIKGHAHRKTDVNLAFTITNCQTVHFCSLHQHCVNYSRFLPVVWSKLKIVTVQWIKSRTWDTIDDWYIKNIAKNQDFAVFHSRVICKSVSPKFRELCMETRQSAKTARHAH